MPDFPKIRCVGGPLDNVFIKNATPEFSYADIVSQITAWESGKYPGEPANAVGVKVEYHRYELVRATVETRQKTVTTPLYVHMAGCCETYGSIEEMREAKSHE